MFYSAEKYYLWVESNPVANADQQLFVRALMHECYDSKFYDKFDILLEDSLLGLGNSGFGDFRAEN